jgi:amino acid transporter
VNDSGNIFSIFLGGVLTIALVTAVGMRGTQLSKTAVSAGILVCLN